MTPRPRSISGEQLELLAQALSDALDWRQPSEVRECADCAALNGQAPDVEQTGEAETELQLDVLADLAAGVELAEHALITRCDTHAADLQLCAAYVRLAAELGLELGS